MPSASRSDATDAERRSEAFSKSQSANTESRRARTQPEENELWLHTQAEPLKTVLTGAVTVLPDGRLLMFHEGDVCTSRDEGRTWSRQPIGNRAGGSKGWESTLIHCASGTLVFVYQDETGKKLEWDNEKHDLTSQPRLEVWSTRSLDHGQTWSEPVRVFDGYCGCIINSIQMRSGRIVVPVQCMLRNPGRHGQSTCISDDEGLTWTQSNILDLGGHGHHDGCFEGSVVQLRDGRLWMVLRTNLERMWQAFSDDQGRYWHAFMPTDIDASSSPAYLKRLASGRLIMAWNRLYPEGLTPEQQAQWERAGGDDNICKPLSSWHRRELSVAFSEDDGQHWTPPLVLMRGKQCSYPIVFEREPGLLWLGTRFGPRVGAAVREADLIAG